MCMYKCDNEMNLFNLMLYNVPTGRIYNKMIQGFVEKFIIKRKM